MGGEGEGGRQHMIETEIDRDIIAWAGRGGGKSLSVSSC